MSVQLCIIVPMVVGRLHLEDTVHMLSMSADCNCAISLV